MGIEVHLLRITNENLERLVRDSDFGYKYIRGISHSELAYYDSIKDEETIGRMLDDHESYLKKSGKYLMTSDWSIINFLLVQKDEILKNNESAPLHFIVRGKHETQIPCVYAPGKVKYLTYEEVKTISKSLESIPTKILEDRYNVEEFNRERIYYKYDTWKQEDIYEIIEGYKMIVHFYQEAALVGEAILVYR